MIRAIKNVFVRKVKHAVDLDAIQNIIYNEPAGAQKNINVEPVVKAAYTSGGIVPFGSYIKLAAGSTAYTLACSGKAYDSSKTHNIGSIVTQAGSVYYCLVNGVTNAFDASKWRKVAAATLGPIPADGSVVICVGKWHNSINVNGFIVDDGSTFSKVDG